MINVTPLKLFLFLLLLTTNVFAETFPSQEIIDFAGQGQESLTLANKLTEIRYRTEMRDSTCQRQVPYEVEECEMVPRYDRVCTTIPGYNDCHTEYDRECRNVTRYKKECHREPSRQVCRNVRRTRRECKPGQCEPDNQGYGPGSQDRKKQAFK